MRNRILGIYPKAIISHSGSVYLYIADFSQRTNKARGVEIHDSKPKSPDDNKDMDCIIINNEVKLSIDYHIFNDNQFKNVNDKDIEHCELCVFPTINDPKSWIGFIEIKDCKVKNINDYKEKAKSQIISTVSEFKAKGIVEKNNIYGIISFPRKKIDFNKTIFEDCTEYKNLYKIHRIHFFATNEVEVVDCLKLRPANRSLT